MYYAFNLNREKLNDSTDSIILSERCENANVLKEALNQEGYDSIVLNDNPLDDEALFALTKLNQLNSLSIAHTSINGTGLEWLLNIPGLKKLNIACNEFLIINTLMHFITNNLLHSKIEELNIAGNDISYANLLSIIELTFKCAYTRPFTLDLGLLNKLSDTQIKDLHRKMNYFAEIYGTTPAFISPSLTDYENTQSRAYEFSFCYL